MMTTMTMMTMTMIFSHLFSHQGLVGLWCLRRSAMPGGSQKVSVCGVRQAHSFATDRCVELFCILTTRLSAVVAVISAPCCTPMRGMISLLYLTMVKKADIVRILMTRKIQ